MLKSWYPALPEKGANFLIYKQGPVGGLDLTSIMLTIHKNSKTNKNLLTIKNLNKYILNERNKKWYQKVS